MSTYKQPGNVITAIAPSGGVTTGDPVKIGQLFGVARNDAAQGDEFELETVGVHELPRATADSAWTVGALVYWNDSTDLATTTSGTNLLIGCVAKDAASDAEVGEVRLNGIALADES